MSAPPRRVHGDGGVYYGGTWVDIEDLATAGWSCPASGASGASPLPPPPPLHAGFDADVLIVGAGCVGAAVARELSKTAARVVLLDASDDVTQGATKGNSGIVHAGYDDAPGSVRAQMCWRGNQLFTQLDKELRFGLQRNGSLVVARGAEDEAVLQELLARGEKNGVERLRIVGREELRAMEPSIAPDATAALFSPDAATLTPYEFTIALAENAVDNGCDLRLNSRLEGLAPLPGGGFSAAVREGGRPPLHARHRRNRAPPAALALAATGACLAVLGVAALLRPALVAGWLPAGAGGPFLPRGTPVIPFASILLSLGCLGASTFLSGRGAGAPPRDSAPRGAYSLRARYVVNAAGEGSGDVAKLLGDDSFYIKPRIGEYLLLNKEQGQKANHILFPTPSKMGKGVLVQQTIWGNLILGPTAADVLDPATAKRTAADICAAILARCRDLVPSFDAGAVIHSFSGRRAKSSTGDWVIRPAAGHPACIHAAGIDSPGLAGSPAIALRVVELLREAGLAPPPNERFNPHRRAIIVPKRHAHGTAPGGVRLITPTAPQFRSPAQWPPPEAHVVCRCEKVTEAEIVDATRRSLPCESTQAVRKRTRAGMGHCQGEFCEDRVKCVLARELGVRAEDVAGRPWPATSILPSRWPSDEEKQAFTKLG